MSADVSTWATTHGDTVEVYRASLSVVRDPDRRLVEEWRYRVKAANNRIVEIGSEAYTRRRAAIRAALRHHPRVEP